MLLKVYPHCVGLPSSAKPKKSVIQLSKFGLFTQSVTVQGEQQMFCAII